jgi:type II secretory pathway pseudopilin PulG
MPMRSFSDPNVDRTGRPARRRGRQNGAVLLEVVLALVLFVAAAAILSSGLSSSLDSVDRLRLQAHAADMAVTIFSELQLGIKTLTLTGQQQFVPPIEGWTWEIVSTPADADSGSDDSIPFKNVEVIIRHESPALVYRLSQVLQIDPAQASKDNQLPGVSSF